MKIVIAGAGNMGFQLAELLALENKDIVLIDTNQRVLDYVNSKLDVLTIYGDAAAFATLEEVNLADTQLFIAVTTSEKTNLVAAMLAKKMGAKKTIARLAKTDHLNTPQINILTDLGIDTLISPRQLAAQEIQRLLSACTFTDISHFDDGKISVIGIYLDKKSPFINRKLSDINNEDLENNFLLIAILRQYKTLIPNGDTVLQKGDHIYFIIKTSHCDRIEKLTNHKKTKVNKIMIVGETPLAYETAKILEDTYSITLIAEDIKRSKQMAARLKNTLVIQGNINDMRLLEEEGIEHMDVFIALTENHESNIIACLMAKNYGVEKTIAEVENKDYVHISQNIGVDRLINKKILAANEIFRYVRKGKVESIKSLQGMDAEIIEYIITKDNVLTRKPLKELHLPKSAIIGGVIRGEEVFIPNGDFILQKDDRVIVFTLPDSIAPIEQLLK